VQFRVTGATGNPFPPGAGNRRVSPSQTSGGIQDSEFGHISLGRVTIDKERLFEEQVEALGYLHLTNLQPDNWKNIAQPVINAIKLIVDTSNKTH
jgi:hypothetical protein